MKSRLPLIFILITFLAVPAVFAQTAPPPPPEAIGPAKGIAVTPGWNYFTLGQNGCSAQKVLDELQADAGGAIAVTGLWVRQADDSWQEYASVNPDSAAATIASDQIVSLSSAGKFFFDLAADQCQQTDPDRQNQILGLRAAAAGGSASDESLLDRLARVPRDFWTGLTGAFKFGQADGDLEFDKTATLDRLTVTDQTNLGPTAVGGSLTVGLVTIDDLDASINSLGETLKLQSLGLSNIEFMGGKVVIDTAGNLKVEGEITAEKVTAEEVETKRLCIEDVCVTKEELKKLLERN